MFISNVFDPKKADIGLSEVSMTAERTKAVLFSRPYAVTFVTFMTSVPNDKVNYEFIFDVFGATVWMLLGLTLLTLFLTIRLLSSRTQLSWSLLSALLNQPMVSRLRTNASVAIFLFFWILSCLVLTKSYSQCLYALMAVPLQSETINSIEELAAAATSQRIKVKTDKSSTGFDLIKVSCDWLSVR